VPSFSSSCGNYLLNNARCSCVQRSVSPEPSLARRRVGSSVQRTARGASATAASGKQTRTHTERGKAGAPLLSLGRGTEHKRHKRSSGTNGFSGACASLGNLFWGVGGKLLNLSSANRKDTCTTANRHRGVSRFVLTSVVGGVRGGVEAPIRPTRAGRGSDPYLGLQRLLPSTAQILY